MAEEESSTRWDRYFLYGSIGVLALTGVAAWLAFALLRPTPPRTVTMATGPEDSSAAALGKRYREILARDGVGVRLVPTAGAVASAALLRDAKSDVSIAILPGGITDQEESPDLVSLGTLFYEPLWLFYREQKGENRPVLRDMRISIGPEGSGSRALALEFFVRAGIIDQASDKQLALMPSESVPKLIHGEIDGVALLGSWEMPGVQQLLAAHDVKLINIRRADAWVQLYPFLNKVTLPAGVVNMAEDIPPTDLVLLAPKASLIVRGNLHPAIQCLLMEAAVEIHSEPGVLRKAGEFPAAESIDLPLSEPARQFYKTGPPFFQRTLPFWLAVFVQQLLVLLIPVLGVLYPLLRFAPGLFGWFMRRRIYRLYDELILLETEIASGSGVTDGKVTRVERLNGLEEKAKKFRMPKSFEPLVYDLRLHISLVREKIEG